MTDPTTGVWSADAESVLARFPSLTAAEPTRLAVLADPHLATEATGTWKCYHRTETFLERAVADLADRDPDATLVAGDLTKDGEPRNFDRYDEVTADLSRTVTVPGNHDVPKSYVDHDVPPVDAFAERYAPGGYPFRERVGGVEVFALDSATAPDGSLRDTWAGAVSADGREWLASELADAEADALSVVLVHHNLFAQSEHDGGFWSNFPLDDRAAVFDVLADHAPVLVVSGHHHVPSVRGRDGVHEVVSPALCSYPPSYPVVDAGPDGTVVRRVPVATLGERLEAYTLGATGPDLGAAVVELAAERAAGEPQ